MQRKAAVRGNALQYSGSPLMEALHSIHVSPSPGTLLGAWGFSFALGSGGDGRQAQSSPSGSAGFGLEEIRRREEGGALAVGLWNILRRDWFDWGVGKGDVGGLLWHGYSSVAREGKGGGGFPDEDG